MVAYYCCGRKTVVKYSTLNNKHFIWWWQKNQKSYLPNIWNVLCPLTMLTQPKLNQILSWKSHDNLIVTCTHKYLFVVFRELLVGWSLNIRGKIQNVSKSQRSIQSLLLVYSTIIHFFLFINYTNYFALNAQSRGAELKFFTKPNGCKLYKLWMI